MEAARHFALLAGSGLLTPVGVTAAFYVAARPPRAPGAIGRPASKLALRVASRLVAAILLLAAASWAMVMVGLSVEFPHLDVAFAFADIVRSWLIAGAGAAAALGFGVFARHSARNCALAGSLLCAAVSCMLFSCMSALAAPLLLAYDLSIVLVAMTAGSALAGTGMWLLRRKLRGAGWLLPASLVAAGLIVLVPGSLAAILPFSDWDTETATPAALAFHPVAIVFLSELAVTAVLAVAGAGVDHQAASRVAHENQRLRQLSDSTFEALLIHRGGYVLDANAAFCEMTGLALAGVHGEQIGRLVPEWGRSVAVSSSTGKPLVVETEIATEDGNRLPVEILSREIAYADGTAQVTAVRDIRERRAAQERIRFLAHHDPLTELPNRAYFRQVMARQLALVRSDDVPVALFYIDLDRFKSVNDTLGHKAGDLLLKQVAARIQACIRDADCAARIGGDEFLLLQTHVVQPSGMLALAERLRAALAEPFDLGGQQASIGASIGIARAPQDGLEPDELIGKADIALYRAKATGRDCFCVFEPGMDAALRRRRELEHEIARALGDDGFTLALQPIFGGSKSEDLCGFEALLRWQRSDGSFIPPDQFIPIAEDTGLIVPIGTWALWTACREAASWDGDLRIAVNVSPRQLASGDFAALVAEVLRETGLAADRLEIEITEAVLIKEVEAAMQTLRRVEQLGVRIALDDFGTGFSSLSYLQRFPLDRVKIDRSFIQSLDRARSGRAITRAILAMCRELHLDVTAEGVETPAQLQYLLSQRCGQFQGFLLGHPMMLGDVRCYIARHRAAAAVPRAWEGIAEASLP